MFWVEKMEKFLSEKVIFLFLFSIFSFWQLFFWVEKSFFETGIARKSNQMEL
jgi:hypothetical protein